MAPKRGAREPGPWKAQEAPDKKPLEAAGPWHQPNILEALGLSPLPGSLAVLDPAGCHPSLLLLVSTKSQQWRERWGGLGSSSGRREQGPSVTSDISSFRPQASRTWNTTRRRLTASWIR